MSYKTILVHADHARHAAQRMTVAARLAQEYEAHLVGAAMSGLSRYIYQDSGMDLSRTVLATHVDALYDRANAALDGFDRIAASAGLASYERRMVDDEPAAALTLQARYADLVVLSQTDLDDPVARVAPGIAEYVMLNAPRPVLMLPSAGTFPHIGKRALVAWDASTEATRAITGALPLLRRAGAVTIAVINPGEDHGPQPGHDIALYLARHGVQAEVLVQRTGGDIGEALLSLAADRTADLLVMGGYGHTRLREMMLGGVTATVLRAMTLPVLMAH